MFTGDIANTTVVTVSKQEVKFYVEKRDEAYDTCSETSWCSSSADRMICCCYPE